MVRHRSNFIVYVTFAGLLILGNLLMGTIGAQTGLNTRIDASIETDQLASGYPDDANLFIGADPADGTPSVRKPLGAPSLFIDWHDLGSNPNGLASHQVLDPKDSDGLDPTAFPRASNCVGPSHVLSSQDLAYVAVASNSEFLYLALQRADNNVDSSYLWLFTTQAPQVIPAGAGCTLTEGRLAFDITFGDILLAGHFSSTPGMLRVFQAAQDVANVGAINAVDFTNSSLWVELGASAVAAVAVNTTVTAPGSLGATGVVALSRGNLEPEIFTEAAIPMSLFAGSSVYGSVMTRLLPAGRSPKLHDLVGPVLLNF